MVNIDLHYRETDLNLLMLFLIEKNPTFRLDIQNHINTGGWRADIKNTYGHGPTPLLAVLHLMSELKITEDDYRKWFKNHDPTTN